MVYTLNRPQILRPVSATALVFFSRVGLMSRQWAQHLDTLDHGQVLQYSRRRAHCLDMSLTQLSQLFKGLMGKHCEINMQLLVCLLN